MDTDRPTPRDWLSREDSVAREGRVERLSWLANELPESEYLSFPGGWIAKQLFEEARYCFTYGQYLAAILLGMAYIEHTLAAIFYAAGRSDLERANISKLLEEAINLGWLSSTEVGYLDRARALRNSVAHFRAFGRTETIEVRAISLEEHPFALLEDDARHVILTAFHIILGRHVAQLFVQSEGLLFSRR